MNLRLFEYKGSLLSEISDSGIILQTPQDIVELIANSQYLGSEKIILRQNQLPDRFFDLKSGLAGEMLQKFATYRAKLAIVGDFQNIESKSLRDFIYESNKHGHILFTQTITEAQELLSQARN